MPGDTFLGKLANVYLDDTELFQTARIMDLEKSPCKESTTVVVDFDKSKERIAKHYKLPLLCSCDALIIDEKNHQIDFIELKSLKKKIVDSYYLIQQVINHRMSGFTGAERDEYNNISKRYIIVFDFDSSIELLFGSFVLLGIEKKLTQILESEIKSAELFNIGSPILKNCATIDKFYKC